MTEANQATEVAISEVLTEHRHIYDVDCDESRGCSCGWTQTPGEEFFDMITRSTIYPNRHWPETLAEDLFSRHLTEQLTKRGLHL